MCIYQEDDKISVLDAILDGSISWEEGLDKIEKLKGLECTVDSFLKEVELSSWEEAQKTIPLFADRQKLLSYSGKSAQSSKEFKVQI